MLATLLNTDGQIPDIFGLISSLESLQRNAVACEGSRFLREQIVNRRLKQQLCQELRQGDSALLQVTNTS